MIFKKTKIEGLYIIELEAREDERGWFVRNFCKEELQKANLEFEIVQANLSLTKSKGSIRGMHFQKEPMSEGKIVQCLKGSVYDVAIDLRPNSSTYGKWEAVELSEENKRMFLIPKNFAHGFQTLTDNCELQYFMSESYSPEHASGVRYNDPLFNIEWPLIVTTLSEKDRVWPLIN